MIWRIVLSEPQVAGLIEIQEKWSINDLMDAHEALDIKEDMTEFFKKKPGENG